MSAPGFRETEEVVFGDFELEDGLGRVREYSDHLRVSRFSSTSKAWKFIFAHSEVLLLFPSVPLFAAIAKWGSKSYNRLVASRIARRRSLGEDDTGERRFWTILVVLLTLGVYLLFCAFGVDRVVSPVRP